jgi:uncharacterized lipoprotein YmbA
MSGRAVVRLRFDGRPGGEVTLDTRWRILSREGDELVFRRSTVTKPTAGPGYQPMVAAMTRALGPSGRRSPPRSGPSCAEGHR